MGCCATTKTAASSYGGFMESIQRVWYGLLSGMYLAMFGIGIAFALEYQVATRSFTGMLLACVVFILTLSFRLAAMERRGNS